MGNRISKSKEMYACLCLLIFVFGGINTDSFSSMLIIIVKQIFLFGDLNSVSTFV